MAAISILTPDEACERVHVRKSMKYQFLRQLPNRCKTKVGGRLRVIEDEFNAWLLSGGDAHKG